MKQPLTIVAASIILLASCSISSSTKNSHNENSSIRANKGVVNDTSLSIKNLLEVHKNVVYPEYAKRHGVEGKVIINALIDANGKPKVCKILSSENEILNESAINAVMNATFSPPICVKDSLECWISIPIMFKLR